MHLLSQRWLVAIPLFLCTCALPAQESRPLQAPVPDLHQLMKDVEEHQKQIRKIQENYTYLAETKTEDLDNRNAVRKTETIVEEVFYVHGAAIARKVKKDGKPLDASEEKKETERVTKAVEKAEKEPSQKQQKEEDELSLSNLLALTDAYQPHREIFRGRPTIVCEFQGRKNAQAHGLGQEAVKKIHGKMWIDEQDRDIVRFEMAFYDNFHVGGGLLANIAKGSWLAFEQAKVNNEIWLPAGVDGDLKARLMLVKGIHQHVLTSFSNYQRFHAEAQQQKAVTVVKEPGKSQK